MWLLFALQISLADEIAAASPVPIPAIFAVSPDGVWLAVGDADRVHVLDGRTLKPVAELEVEARSAAFDERGRILTLAGARLVRIETGTWRGLFRAPLPDVAPARPLPVTLVPPVRITGRRRFAVDPETDPPTRRLPPVVHARPGGEVYYLTTEGTVRRAVEAGGRLEVEDLGGKPGDLVPQRISGIVGFAGGVPVVELETLTGILLRGRCYTLSLSSDPLDAAESGGRLALLTEAHQMTYDTSSWKAFRPREVRAGASLALSVPRAWAFTSDADGLHAWRPDVAGRRVTIGPPVHRLAVDAAATALFAADGTRLLRWRIDGP